jgi:hypothetical protein
MNHVLQVIRLESKWVEDDNRIHTLTTNVHRLETEQRISETKGLLLQTLISLTVTDSDQGSSHDLQVDDNPVALQYLLKSSIRILDRLCYESYLQREEKKLLLRIFEICLEVFRIFKKKGLCHVKMKLNDYHSLTLVSLFFLESTRKIYYVASSPAATSTGQQNDSDYEYLLEMLLDFLTIFFFSLPVLLSDCQSFLGVSSLSSPLFESYTIGVLKENVFSQIIHTCLLLSTYQPSSSAPVTLNYSKMAVKSVHLIRCCLKCLSTLLYPSSLSSPSSSNNDEAMKDEILRFSMVTRFFRQSFPGIFSLVVNFIRKSLLVASYLSYSVIKM